VGRVQVAGVAEEVGFGNYDSGRDRSGRDGFLGWRDCGFGFGLAWEYGKSIIDFTCSVLNEPGVQVVQKLFERCSAGPRFGMLERIGPHLAMIGIHKNGTWAAQKIIECVQTPEEIASVAQNLRAYAPPLFLDQYGNYVVQCVPLCCSLPIKWI
jgi:hypothetical protein